MTDALQDSMYHRVLRVAAVVAAVVLLFESGVVTDSTAALSLNTHSYLANAVGMTASIEPTELNTLTAELTAQKKRLDEREAALSEREIEIGLATAKEQNQRATYRLASILFVLLILIVLNYALDFIRAKEALQRQEPQTV